MAQLIIRNLDEKVVAALEARAKRRGQSLEQELRDILTAVARSRPHERLAVAQRVAGMTPGELSTDSTDLVRADRGGR